MKKLPWHLHPFREPRKPKPKMRLLLTLQLIVSITILHKILNINPWPTHNFQQLLAKKQLNFSQLVRSSPHLGLPDNNSDTTANVGLAHLIANATKSWKEPKTENALSRTHANRCQCLLTIALILAGDIHPNPGPRASTADIYPCGLCSRPVTWNDDGVCCDDCDIWLHRSCISMCSRDYSLISRPNIQWICCRCHSTNLDSFIFHSLELTNSFTPLSQLSSGEATTPPRSSSPRLLQQHAKCCFSPNLSPISCAKSPTHPDSLNRTNSSQISPRPVRSPPETTAQLGDKRPEQMRKPQSRSEVKQIASPQLHTQTPPPAPSDQHAGSDTNPETSNSLLTESGLREIKSKNKLRILSFNCQSIVKKRAHLALVINQYKPDIICGTESWLRGVKPGKEPAKNAIQSSEIFPPEFTIHRNDRDSTHPGGGVFIGIHESLAPWSEVNLEPITNCEIVWCKTHIKGTKPLHFGCFYMAKRNHADLDLLNDSLKKLKSDNGKNIFLFGDFNCPDVDWDKNTAEKSTPSSTELNIQEHLADLAAENLLTQVHRQSTRVNNMLDLVFTTNESLIQSTTSVPGISDHDIIITDANIKPPANRKPPRKSYKFHKADWNSVDGKIQILQQKINSLLNEGKSINELWTSFRDSLKDIIDQHIPYKIVKSRPSLPWVNHSIQKMLKRKAKLYKKASESKDWSQFKDFQKDCRKKIRNAEWEFINKTIIEGFEENNSKPFWKYIKSRRQDNNGVAALKSKSNDSLLTDPVDKANALIEQFKSVFTTPDEAEDLPEVSVNKMESPIAHIRVHQQGVKKLLENIKTTKAVGPDGIPNQVLKQCADSIAPIMTAIFQTSLDTGTLPKDWLNANVAPIFKKGDRQRSENYRPVSLTSVSSKLLEHIICKELLNHLEANKILTSLNHGFRSGYSCETQLIVTLKDLMTAYEANLQTDVAILDFSKAFDTVPHRKLLHKLEAYGVRGSILKWFACFLTQRSMRVVVDGKASKSVHVASGVPQGTVLGPILFLCHINDLPDSVKSQVRLFADDCLLYRIIDTLRDHVTLQNDLQNLETWAEKWGMRFNPNKCYVMSIKEKSSHFYQLCGQILSNVNQNPYLGVLLANDLKWAPHINQISSKASSTLGFLRRNLRNCPENCKKLAYLSLVRPSLEYAANAWDPHYQKDIDRLEKIQRKAVRFITGDYRSREEGFITNKMKELDLLPLQDRRKASRLSLFYKITRNQVPAINPDDHLIKDHNARLRKRPEYLEDYCTATSSTNSTRNNYSCFKKMHGSTDQFTNSFFPRTIVDWNNLPEDIISKTSVEAFKTALKTPNAT